MGKRWIQDADLKKDGLRDYVQRKYGSRGFTKRGTIKPEILNSLADNPRVQEKTRKRARLAKTLRKMS